jgi:LCP family protein required for cell wall assembly
VRTTLKRGIGRGASVNGNGRAILPPGPYTPVRLYRQPQPEHGAWRVAGRVATWLGAIVLMLAGGVAGGVYLWLHHTLQAVAPHGEDKESTKQLAAGGTDPSKPAIALVIGYDRRYGEVGHSRSDTIMLVRTQPNPPAVSILSFPRDLAVDVTCPGQEIGLQKINAAYAFCGSPGSMSTIKALTGLPINYLITVNFRGFTQVVDKMGGIWIDVDRKYFHSNNGTSPGSFERYSEINLQPGYQKLNGAQALSFVRYRHTDDDTYRNARQQLFLKAVRQQISKVGVTDMLRVLHAIVSNVVVGRKGGGAPSEETMFNYAQWLYGLPKGNIFQVKIDGIANTYNSALGDIVEPNPGAIAAAVHEFQHPDVAAPEETGSQVLHKRIGAKRAAPRPSQTTVSVMNANGIAGSAGLAVAGLDRIGYRIRYPANGTPADAPPHTCPTVHCFKTQVYWNPTKKRSKAAAVKVAALFGSANVLKLPQKLKPDTNGSMVLVAVGTTFHGTLAPAPVDHVRKRQKPEVTFAPGATQNRLARAQRKVPFELEVPTLLAANSSPDSQEPIRTYRIDGDKRAVRLSFSFENGGYTEYWGVEQTDWTDAPVLADANFDHTSKGRHYRFYWNGSDLHMIALYENGATYWVVNTLLDSLSPETMTAIAKGLKPLSAAKKK